MFQARTDPPGVSRVRSQRALSEERTAYAFILPALALSLCFCLYPLLNSVYLSCTVWGGIGPAKWVGMQNFRFMLDDPKFFNAFSVTLKYMVGSVAGIMVVGFFLALALHTEIRGWKFFQVLFFLNCILSTSVIAILWGSLLHPINGPVTAILKNFIASPPLWLADYKLTIWVVCAIDVWKSSGYIMLFIFTAMQGISPDLYEAAELDGITFWKKVWYIILPIIRPVLTILFLLQVIGAFKVFDILYALTKGGPNDSTMALGLFLYNQGFWFKKFGYGSAVAVVMLVCVVFLSVFYLKSVTANNDTSAT